VNIINIFQKDLKEVNLEDLQILKNINEGWFIEYKSSNPGSKKIAKSIASFANSYGGFYFLGIESSHDNNLAFKFDGVPDCPDIIHDSVRGNVNPFPYFDVYVIKVNEKNNVIMVHVLEGENTPYISYDGRIYRRQESSSDPIFETDRFTIDCLYNKYSEIEKEKDKFRKINYFFSKEEYEIPYFITYANLIPWHNFKLKEFIGKNFLNELKTIFNNFVSFNIKYDDKDIIKIRGQLFFDNIFRYYDSICLKQIYENYINSNCLTIEIDKYANIKILIPLEYKEKENLLNDHPAFNNYFLANKITCSNFIKFIDLTKLINVLTFLLYNYFDLLKKYDYHNDIEFRFETLNCQNTSLYITNEKYIDHIKEYGIPICLKGSQIFPEKATRIDFNEIKKEAGVGIITLISIYLTCFGLSAEDIYLISDVFNQNNNN
jgi:hypothetical protein